MFVPLNSPVMMTVATVSKFTTVNMLLIIVDSRTPQDSNTKITWVISNGYNEQDSGTTQSYLTEAEQRWKTENPDMWTKNWRPWGKDASLSSSLDNRTKRLRNCWGLWRHLQYLHTRVFGECVLVLVNWQFTCLKTTWIEYTKNR